MAKNLYIYKCTKDGITLEVLEDVVMKRDGKIIRRIVNNQYMLCHTHTYYNKIELNKYVQFRDEQGHVACVRYISVTKGLVDINKLKEPIVTSLLERLRVIHDTIETIDGYEVIKDATKKDIQSK